MSADAELNLSPTTRLREGLDEVMSAVEALRTISVGLYDPGEQRAVAYVVNNLDSDLRRLREALSADADADLLALCDACQRHDAEQAAAPTDEEIDAAAERRRAVLESIIPVTPRTSVGLAAKMRVLLEQAALNDRLEPNSSRALVVDAYAIAGQPEPQPFMPWTDNEIAAKRGEAETPAG